MFFKTIMYNPFSLEKWITFNGLWELEVEKNTLCLLLQWKTWEPEWLSDLLQNETRPGTLPPASTSCVFSHMLCGFVWREWFLYGYEI